MQLFICTEGSHLNGTFKQEVNIITSDSIGEEGGGCICLEVPNVVFVEYIFSCICSLQSPPRDLLKS